VTGNAYQIDAFEPEWLAALRAEAKRSSIAEVARLVGISRTAASLVLAGKYPARTDHIEASVMSRLCHRVVCPGLGRDIAMDECRDWAAKPYAATNSQRIHMYQACRRCPLRPEEGK
jgi:hypothetical protein